MSDDRLEYGLEVTLTDDCNFACDYCFEGESCLKNTTLDCIENIFDAIDTMFNDEWFVSKFKGIRIGFWGGEPTLRPDLLAKFVERYKDDERINYHIYTNGYDIEQLMNIFEDCKDRLDVQVSYDGERIHDLKRVTKGGVKTASRVRDNVYTLVNRGFIVGIKSTVTYDTVQYMADCFDDIRQMNRDLGERIRYTITMDYFNEIGVDMNSLRKAFVAVAKKDLDFHRENGYHLFSRFNDDYPVHCNFYKHGMALATNGDMMYCHGCGYSTETEKLCFGNISDTDFMDKIKHNNTFFVDTQKKPECDDCYAVSCVMCNVTKYCHSDKDDFLDRWYDLPCQKDHCDMFREFSKVSMSLKDILRR